MIWVVLAVLTGAAVLAVLWPLSWRARDGGAANDVAVYKDQLEEIERDQRFGLIVPSEAEAARIEVSRRLIAAADTAAKGEVPAVSGAGRTAPSTSTTEQRSRSRIGRRFHHGGESILRRRPAA